MTPIVIGALVLIAAALVRGQLAEDRRAANRRAALNPLSAPSQPIGPVPSSDLRSSTRTYQRRADCGVLISSTWSWFYNVQFAIYFPIAFVTAFFLRDTPALDPFVITAAILLAPIAWNAGRFKRVMMDDHSLYVSNFRQEIVVPLSAVDRVSHSGWTTLHPVTIHFNQDTPFGRNVVFVPWSMRLLSPFRKPAIVAKIEEAASVARSMGSGGSAA